MRLLLLLSLLIASLVLIESASSNNSTKPRRKTLRMVKRLKKGSRKLKKTSKSGDLGKSASYHMPIVVSSEDVSHLPVKLELHEDDKYIRSAADMHPIEPIHLINLDNGFQHQQTHPLYIESKDPLYSSHPADSSRADPVYRGAIAVPIDYPTGRADDHSYSPSTEIAPHEYYPDDYPGDLSAIPGSPGVDYPNFAFLPKTGFECLAHTATPGFYADVETKCQMWHYCQPDGRHDRFLCPNGTVFDQLTRVCNWWFNVHCDSALSLYDINFDLYRVPAKAPSQSLVAEPYQPHSAPSHPKSVDTVPNPNSFLRHVKDFEASLGQQNYGDYISSADNQHNYKPIQSAASPRAVHRYPSKVAPVPKVVHEYDAGQIDYDSSNAYSLSTPSDDFKLPLKEVKPKLRKKVARRKLRKHPRIYSKNDDDDIPTYREGKVTPASTSRRHRVVRRRKLNKN